MLPEKLIVSEGGSHPNIKTRTQFFSQSERRKTKNQVLSPGWLGGGRGQISLKVVASLSFIHQVELFDKQFFAATMSVSGIIPLYMCGKYIQCSAVGGDADGKPFRVFYDRSRTEHKPITVYKITQ